MSYAEQQTRILSNEDSLATGEADKVKAHARVLPEILDRRHIRSRIDVAGNVVLVSNLQPLFASDLCRRAVLFFRCVEEVGHNGLLVERALVIIKRYDLADYRPTQHHRVI